MSLRDYQVEAISSIQSAFREGHRKVLLNLATGGGKTTVFCTIAKRAALKGKKTAIIVRGRKLVDQASSRLHRENLDHGVMMAGHFNYRPRMPHQVCSIDTLRARNITLDADLIIIDEAHLFTSDGDKEYLDRYSDKFMLSVTATPYCPDGLRHLADVMVKPTSMSELIDNGYLVPFRYFAPSEPDLKNVKINKQSGDYVNEQLEDAMVSGHLTGKIIDNWLSIACGLPTILFAVNIRHSKMLVERFRDAGISAEHCDADTPDDQRAEIIKRLESGETKVVSNVGIFCTGVDIPSLGAIIMARPTTSLNLYIQQAGRGTRIFKGKDSCILIDHAGNIRRHGYPTDEPEVDLDGKVKESHEKKSKKCKLCFMIFRDSPHCPVCGPQDRPESEVLEIIETEDKLVEIKVDNDPIKRSLRELLKTAKMRGYRPLWASHRLVAMYGLEKAEPYLSPAFVERYKGKLIREYLDKSAEAN